MFCFGTLQLSLSIHSAGSNPLNFQEIFLNSRYMTEKLEDQWSSQGQ